MQRLKNSPFIDNKQILLFLMPGLLLFVMMSLIVYRYHKEELNTIQNDMDVVITQLSEDLTKDEKIAYAQQEEVISILSNNTYGILNEKEIVYIYSLRQPKKELEVIVQVNPSNHIEKIPLNDVEENFISILERVNDLNEIHHSNIYKRKEDYLLSSFTPLRDSKGETIGVIGMETTINELLFKHLKTIITILIIVVICSVSFITIFKKWLRKTTIPFHHMIVNIQELSSSENDRKTEQQEFYDPSIMIVSINEFLEQIKVLFYRVSTNAKELGTMENDYQLITMSEALLQLEYIMKFSKINKELQHAEKMNAVGQLAASVAHEIRNPMTVVKGFLQIFYAKEHLSKEERLYIHLMIEEMDRAETIINDYLSIAKPKVENEEKVDGFEVAMKVLDLMQSYAMMGKGIIFQKDLQHVYIRASNSELKQVLINIIKNAIEAMRNGGTLSVSLNVHEDFAVYKVTDTGVGMTKEEIERLGTAFYSLKEKGTGMGLLVCYQMVKKMDGKIKVESEKGKGTTFKVYIPLFKEEGTWK